MKINQICVLFFVFLISSCKSEIKQKIAENKTTILKGCVYGRDSDTILLVRSFEDARNDSIVSIPIINYEFEFEFEPKEIEAYNLIFKDEHNKGAWRPIKFFAEKDTIQFNLHETDNFDENEIKGGILNDVQQNYSKQILKKYSAQLDEVYKVLDSIPYETMNSFAYNKIIERLREVKTQEERVVIYAEMEKLKRDELHRSEFGKKIDSQVAIIQNQYLDIKYDYIEKNPTIVSYSLLLDDILSLKYNPVPKEKLIVALNNLKDVFPNHPYTKLSQNLWIGYTEMNPGGQYINFAAPDINETIYELKPVVDKNKVVLLDLWATWCGPCIARTRLIRPVYEEYKDKGFSILGVAGEYKTLDTYKRFMAKEQWPWQNLIELDKENKIWEKYNVMNGGGGMFLIDGSGEILAVDPTADEVKDILDKKLQVQEVKM